MSVNSFILGILVSSIVLILLPSVGIKCEIDPLNIVNTVVAVFVVLYLNGRTKKQDTSASFYNRYITMQSDKMNKLLCDFSESLTKYPSYQDSSALLRKLEGITQNIELYLKESGTITFRGSIKSITDDIEELENLIVTKMDFFRENNNLEEFKLDFDSISDKLNRDINHLGRELVIDSIS